ncbi:MAG: translation initiation factor IF-3 [Calditrichaeota bacterium]|nr:translation initiation factor IF-3 [Candidatus Cloacimonadota bacterium]MCB1046583.1 translation initiation factor IF-3 [Calditrichota bacterium]MCB9473187.1 translation initiation factor IF-3 [Candidatus Delongbacteria bacterium]
MAKARFRPKPVPQAPKNNINDKIRVPEVRLIDQDGEQRGVVETSVALQMAIDAGADLVEVAPNAEPPVCKIMDYGKFLYQASKKEKAAKARQHTITVKSIRMTPMINAHDLETKVQHTREFLAEGNKVKIFVMFRGRMITHKDLGFATLAKVIELIGDAAVVEQQPLMEGPRNLSILLSPGKKKTTTTHETDE